MKHSAVDQHTGRTYHFIDIDGKKAIRPYVTQQHWGCGQRRICHRDRRADETVLL